MAGPLLEAKWRRVGDHPDRSGEHRSISARARGMCEVKIVVVALPTHVWRPSRRGMGLALRRELVGVRQMTVTAGRCPQSVPYSCAGTDHQGVIQSGIKHPVCHCKTAFGGRPVAWMTSIFAGSGTGARWRVAPEYRCGGAEQARRIRRIYGVKGAQLAGPSRSARAYSHG